MNVGLGFLGSVFVRSFRFSILCFFSDLDYFVFVLFVFVVLRLVSSVLCPEIG